MSYFSSRGTMLIVIFLMLVVQAFAQFKQHNFVIGTFADPNLSKPQSWEKDVASFQKAKDAYINLLTGPQFYTGARDFSMMDRVLKVADKVGLQLLVIDSRLSISQDTFTSAKADFLIRHFKSVENKSLIGYNFGGEFPSPFTPKITKWIGYFKSKHPGKLIYTYLLPRYGFKSDKEYEQYLDGYLKPANARNAPDVVSFDHYPFIGPEKLRGDYFYNLKVIKDKAGKRPFWIYVLTTKHLIYPEPDQYQLYFTCFCPIAYGAKGLLYFTYETLPQKMFGDGLLTKSGAPTPKFNIVKKINRYIHDIIGPIVMKSTRIATYHSSNTSPYENVKNQVLPAKNNYIQSIDNKDILVGIFRNNQNKNIHYVFVVNKSNKNAEKVNLAVRNTLGRKYTISPPVSTYDGTEKSIPLGPETVNSTNSALTFSLTAGEGRLITIAK